MSAEGHPVYARREMERTSFSGEDSSDETSLSASSPNIYSLFPDTRPSLRRTPSASSLDSVASMGWDIPESLRGNPTQTNDIPEYQARDLTQEVEISRKPPIAEGGYSSVRLGTWKTQELSAQHCEETLQVRHSSLVLGIRL